MATITRHPKFSAGARRALRLGLQALAALVVTVVVALATAPAQAQTQTRPIPESARLAKLKLGVFPDAELDGRRVTLGPGVRIFSRDNMLVIPAALKDTTSTVAYVTGSLGEIITVWILDEAEVKQLRARARKSG
jgi:hypothetical protein